MNNEKLNIVAIGECLIELSANTKMSDAECLYKYYGGDTLAAAIAALRMGSKVGFITRVGNDSFKDYLLDGWHSEGLDISQVKISNLPNGLYIIARPSCQEKEIALYRKKIAPSKLSIEDINEELVSQNMYYKLPDVDFLIRTSGENRISNFMLWQLSYAEFYFPTTYFPDFDEKCLDEAIKEYQKRDRRFGKIK